MAIAPEAIERYLTAPLPHVPEFKGVSPDILRQRIIDVTGRPLASKTEPRYYQLEGVAFALYLRQSLLFFWMRLGKTKTAIDWANQLIVCDIVRGKGLVVAHSPQGAEVWESEIPKHSDLRAQVVHAGPELGERFIAALESDCHIIVAAHSVLQILFAEKKVMPRKGVPKLYPDHEAIALAAEYFSFGIIDEIHLVANPEGLRFQICKGLLVNCRYRLGLTGTPVGRVAYPVWAIAALIDDGRTFGKSYHFFEYAFGKQVKAFFGKRKTQIIFVRNEYSFQDRFARRLAAPLLSGFDVYVLKLFGDSVLCSWFRSAR